MPTAPANRRIAQPRVFFPVLSSSPFFTRADYFYHSSSSTSSSNFLSPTNRPLSINNDSSSNSKKVSYTSTTCIKRSSLVMSSSSSSSPPSPLLSSNIGNNDNHNNNNNSNDNGPYLSIFSSQGVDLGPAADALAAYVDANTQPDNPLLIAFVSLACEALANDVGIAPHALSLSQLARKNDPAIQGALLALIHLSRLFYRLPSSSSSSLTTNSILPKDIFQSSVGFCTGILPSAASISASTPSELLSNAVDAVRISYILGQVSAAGADSKNNLDSNNLNLDNINSTSSSSSPNASSWSVLISTPPPPRSTAPLDIEILQERIDQLNNRISSSEEASIADSSSSSSSASSVKLHPIYISAVSSSTSVTLSGHPSLLDAFQASLRIDPIPELPPLRLTPLPAISSPYHSSLLGPDAVNKALQIVNDRHLQITRQPHLAIASLKKCYPELHLDDIDNHSNDDIILDRLHSQLFRVILELPCRWDNVCDLIIQDLVPEENNNDYGSQSLRIAPFGPAALGLASTLATRAKTARPGLNVLVDPDPDTFESHTQNPLLPSFSSPQSQQYFESTTNGALADEIAIISTACRFPGQIDSNKSLFDSLLASNVFSRSLVHDPQSQKLFNSPAYASHNLIPENAHHYPLENIDLFDPRLFNISPKEAEQLDPTHRLAIMTAYEALERAGYAPGVKDTLSRERIGVWFGAMADDYRENASDAIASYFITGNIRAFIPGRISFYFDWQGPSNSVDTAETSTIVSIETAIQALQAGQCDTALAGGVAVATQPQIWIALAKDGIISPDATFNKTLDNLNNGAVRGDGAGVIIMKRLQDAVRDNDNILATIPAASSASLPSIPPHLISSTSPEQLASLSKRRINAIKSNIDNLFSLSSPALDPNLDLAAIELSGWNDSVGEADEIKALHSSIIASRSPKNNIYLGSVRPNLGASEAASGLAGVMKAIMMVHTGLIPPHVGVSPDGKLNSQIEDLVTTKNNNDKECNRKASLVVPSYTASFNIQNERDAQATTLPTPPRRKAVLLNTLSPTGNQAALIIRQPPVVTQRRHNILTPSNVVTISAKTANSLESLKQGYIKFLTDSSSSICRGSRSLLDLSVMTTARRLHHPLRIAVPYEFVYNKDGDIDTNASVKKLVDSIQNAPSNVDKTERKKLSIGFSFESLCSKLYNGDIKVFENLVLNFAAYSSAVDTVLKQVVHLTTASGFPNPLAATSKKQDSNNNNKNNDHDGEFRPAPTTLSLVLQLGLALHLRNANIRPERISVMGEGILPALVLDNVIALEDAVQIANSIDFTASPEIILALINQLNDDLRLGFSSRPPAIEVPAGGGHGTSGNNKDSTPKPCQWTHPITSKLIDSPSDLVDLVHEQISMIASLTQRPPSPPLSDTSDAGHDYTATSTSNKDPILRKGVVPDTMNLPETENFTWLSLSSSNNDGDNQVKSVFGSSFLSTSTMSTPEWKSFCNLIVDFYLAHQEIDWKNWHSYSTLNDARLIEDLPTYAFDLNRYWIEYKDRCLLPIPGAEDDGLDDSQEEDYDDDDEFDQLDDYSDNEKGGLAPYRSTPYPLLQACLDSSVTSKDNVQEGDSLPVYRTKVHSQYALPLISGHTVHHKAIVAATTWSEMALEYIRDVSFSYPSFESPSYQVNNVDIVGPLILDSQEAGQIMQVQATVSQKDSLPCADLTFASGQDTVNQDILGFDQPSKSHLTCSVSLVPDEAIWQAEWDKISPLIHSRIDDLKKEASGSSRRSKTSTLGTRMAYKLFQVAVDYERHYQGMKSVTFNPESGEATTVVKMNKTAPKGNFVVHPCLGDSLGQISGFISNVGNQDPNSVYIANFIETIRYSTRFVTLNASRNVTGVSPTFLTYCSMKPDNPENPTAMIGDVFILEDSPQRPIIGCMYGIRFKRVPVKVFETLLGVKKPAGGAKPNAKKPAVTPAAPSSAPAKPKTVKRKVKKLVPKNSQSGGGGGSNGGSSAVQKSLDEVKETICRELNIEASELHDHANFAELGLDSLLSIVILGGLRETMDIELPGSLFQDYPTIADVRSFFQSKLGDSGGDGGANDSNNNEMIEIEVEEEVPVEDEAPVTRKVKKIVKRKKASGGSGGAGSKANECAGNVQSTIAQELGLELSDIHDHANFAELGLDSLLSIVILGGLRESFDFELPGTFFQDYPTLGDVKKYFAEMFPSEGGGDDDEEFEEEIEVEEEIPVEPSTQEANTDATQSSSPAAATPSTSSGGGKVTEALNRTRDIIIQELQLENPDDELTPNVELGHLGLDSLMALVVRGRLDEELDFQVPQNLFMDCLTLKEVEAAYAGILGPDQPEPTPEPPKQQEVPAPAPAPTPAPAPAPPAPATAPAKQDAVAPKIKLFRPVCLSAEKGSPNASKTPLFLIPDGSGNAAAYAAFVPIGRPLYGCTSPFVKDSTHWNGGMNQIAKLYIESIKLIQPKGPYYLGGWSFGGIVAYEMARILAEYPDEDDCVNHLIFIDSPSPQMPGLPLSIGDYIYKRMNLMTLDFSPELSAHLNKSCIYHEQEPGNPWDPTKPKPHATLITAQEGIYGKAEDVAGYNITVDWIMKSRANVDANGWEKMLGDNWIRIMRLEHANHFDLVKPPHVKELCSLVRESCDLIES